MTEVFNNIDWKMLREQKQILVILSEIETISQTERDALVGIINLLDSFQDKAVEEEYETDKEVFGTPPYCPKCGSEDIEPSWCAHGYMQCETCGCEWLDPDHSTKLVGDPHCETCKHRNKDRLKCDMFNVDIELSHWCYHWVLKE